MSDENVVTGFSIVPDKSPKECMALCVELCLLERMTHGDDEYIRFTQLGHNVMAALLSIGEFVDLDHPFKAS